MGKGHTLKLWEKSEMAKFQLWSRDEYGQGSIIATSENKSEMIKRARTEINGGNVDNALTIDDKKKSWEAYFVEIKPAEENSESGGYVYGGKGLGNKNVAYDYNDNPVDMTNGIDGHKVVIYLGDLDKKAWYATEPRGTEINSLDHQDLQGKVVYFIKKVG